MNGTSLLHDAVKERVRSLHPDTNSEGANGTGEGAVASDLHPVREGQAVKSPHSVAKTEAEPTNITQ
jgi:hypothetical protein